MPNSDQTNAFLAKIAQLESSGGKNINHPMVTQGPLKGQTAIGNWALMPSTVQEIVKRRQMQEGNLPPDWQQLQGMKQPGLRMTLEQNPDLQQQLAGNLAQKVLDRQSGNQDKAAYAWNSGTNLSPQGITPQKLANSDYVQRFQKLKGLVPLSQTASITPQSYDLNGLDDQNQSSNYDFSGLNNGSNQ